MLEAHGLTKIYQRGGVAVTALAGVDLAIGDGEFLAIAGTSGAGKSTLLHLLGALEKPTSGAVSWQGQDLADLPDRKLTALRRSAFGFVFQSFNLVPTLTAVENVESAMSGTRRPRRTRRRWALGLLDQVGLAGRATHLPDHLSGGEQQRVAIARALANDPSVIFADEPTGNLDFETGLRIVSVLRQLHRDRGLAVVVVTHDLDVAQEAQRVVRMRDGCVLSGPAATANSLTAVQTATA